MKNLIILFILLISLLKTKNSTAQEYPVNKSFTSSTELFIFKSANLIGSFKLNADVKLNSKRSLIRIILVDKAYSEKLVFESYYQLVDDDSTFSVTNACDETELLNNLQPSYVKVQIIDAHITIKSFIAGPPISALKSANIENDQKIVIAAKNKLKVNQLNKYISKNGQLWAAGQTNISNLPYERKKQIFGNDNYNSYGLEYYVGGIFELDDGTVSQNSSSLSNNLSATSDYIDHFDWRERHGANKPGTPYYDGDPDGSGWLTSVKNQYKLGDCWAFATIGEVEVVANLYYNRHIDMDLSEYDITTCSGSGNCSIGGLTNSALSYVVNTGVVDESSYPNPDPEVTVCSTSCGKPANPTDIVKIESFEPAYWLNSEDELKRKIIQSPLTGPIKSIKHTMVLCGYHKIEAGDTLVYIINGYAVTKIILPTDINIGKTYWIFKNSYGTDSNNGYWYVLLKNFNDFEFGDMCQAIPPITNLHYTANDIRCVDLDGDGYFNWGIGTKPPYPVSPLCSPNEEDGDDSNPNLGPMDMYGYCMPISSPYTFPDHPITTIETWQNTNTECGNVIVKNGGDLTINGGDTNLEGTAYFSVEVGGTLTFNSGTIQ